MAVGKAYEAWNHTSSIMALLATINSDPKAGTTFRPSDFHPFCQRAQQIPVASPELLAALGFTVKPGATTNG
jgi:hypothetical protein